MIGPECRSSSQRTSGRRAGDRKKGLSRENKSGIFWFSDRNGPGSVPQPRDPNRVGNRASVARASRMGQGFTPRRKGAKPPRKKKVLSYREHSDTEKTPWKLKSFLSKISSFSLGVLGGSHFLILFLGGFASWRLGVNPSALSVLERWVPCSRLREHAHAASRRGHGTRPVNTGLTEH